MTRLGQMMTGLQAHAQALQDAQLRHETVQTRLHNAMEVGLNASLGQLFVIEGSTAMLQGALQDASQSIAQITSLAWIMSSFWKWSSFAVILSLVAFAVSSRDASIARYMAAAIGKIPITFLLLPLTVFRRSHDHYQVLKRSIARSSQRALPAPYISPFRTASRLRIRHWCYDIYRMLLLSQKVLNRQATVVSRFKHAASWPGLLRTKASQHVENLGR